MGTYIFLAIALFVCTNTVKAWPFQTPNNQPVPPQWTGGQDDKQFEVPKSVASPFPAPPVPTGANGPPPQFPQKAPNQWQGLGTDPWSSFQTNNPFGGMDLSSQEPGPPEGLNGLGGNPEGFPHIRPYRPLFPPPESPFSGGSGAAPPPRGPSMPMGGMAQMPPPPPQRQHPFAHMQMGGQGRPFDWPSITGRSNAPEMPPQPSAFDTPGRYPIEYSPRPPNGSVPAITVQYNVTYAFTPWGWRSIDVSVSNATFHPSSSEKVVELTGAPPEGLVQQPEMNRNQDSMTSNWWWPRKQGFESNPKLNGPRPEEIGAGFTNLGDPAASSSP